MSNKTGLPGLLSAAAFAAVMLLPALSPTPVRGADEEECYRCHGLEGFARLQDSEPYRLWISPERFERSVHGILNCRECHSRVAAIPHPDADGSVSCGQICHQQNQRGDTYSHDTLFWDFSSSVHGDKSEEKMSCLVCHPSSSLTDIVPRDKVLESKQCASCHRENEKVRDYFQSFHYAALSSGYRRAPSCPDCHTAHRVFSAGSEESSVNSAALVQTCSKGALGASPSACHGVLTEEQVRGAGMSSLLPAGIRPGASRHIFTLLFYILLAGLALRAGLGFLTGK